MKSCLSVTTRFHTRLQRSLAALRDFRKANSQCYLRLLMHLHINGEQRDFPDGLTVAGLVAQLGMKPDRVAVELNLEIVPRTQWETTTLKNGDKLEVVHFVGGGSPDLANV